MTHGVLVYCLQKGKVLLAKYKDAKWNGLKGSMKKNERAHDAAKRAAKELVGVTVDRGEPLGTVTYHHPKLGHWDVTVFRAKSLSGEPERSKEATPQWFDAQDLPFKEMWPGDHLFMYRVLEEKPFTIDIWFDEQGQIAKQQVEFV